MEEQRNRKIIEVRYLDAEGVVLDRHYTIDPNVDALMTDYQGAAVDYLKKCKNCANVEVIKHPAYSLGDLRKTSHGFALMEAQVQAQLDAVQQQKAAKMAEESK